MTRQHLQTVYYSRSAKTIQADTYWQHCRMFGYDRDRGLVRLFIPHFVFKRFQELNESQKVLVKQINAGKKFDDILILYANGIKPTRDNVVDNSKLSYFDGGVNYFTAYPVNDTLAELDELLMPFDKKGTQDVPLDTIFAVLSKIGSENPVADWTPKTEFVDAVRMIADKKNIKTAKLLVSSDHRISKGTGTMLTPTDRREFDVHSDSISLIMYRLTGTQELKWGGSPLWMPNVKLPIGFRYYKMEG